MSLTNHTALFSNENGSFLLPETLLKIIIHTIDAFHMLEPKETVLIAVSGGPDSVALTRVLHALRDKYQISLGIAHFNHLLRPKDAQKDEDFVRQLAKNLTLPFFCEQEDVKAFAGEKKVSIETAGRDLRYAFFDRIAMAHGYTKIATGHTRDDNVEQVLMNLLRGAGPAGLSGIPPIRDRRIIRPLIDIPKKEILALLKMNCQHYQIDSSNMDPVYLRNRVRNSLIPLLESDFNPEIADALNRLSTIIRQEEEYLNQQTDKAFANCLTHQETHEIVFLKTKLEALHPALLNRVLRTGIRRIKTDLNQISLLHINTIVDFCFHSLEGKSLDLPGQIRIYKSQKTIKIKKEDRPLRNIGRQLKTKKNRNTIGFEAIK